MSGGFRRIAADFAEEPYFHLLYVGRDLETSGRLLAEARDSGWFERVVAAPAAGDLAKVDLLVHEAGLRSGDSRGCLVVVWDLDGLRAGGVASGGLDLGYLGPLLGRAQKWSPQVISFGLSSAPEVTFLELTDLLALEVAGVGDVDVCLSTLRSWCAPSSCGAVGFRASIHKAPSGWLKFITHDYLRGGVLLASVRPDLSAAGLESSQVVIDYWQDALRNVLVYTRSNTPARALVSRRSEDEPEVASAISQAAFQLVAPGWLGAPLRNLRQVEGENFTLYSTPSGAFAEVMRLRQEGCALVLLWEDPLDPPQIGGLGEILSVPVVLVGEDAPPRADWPRWRRLFAGNVLGGFSLDELLAPGPRGGNSILDAKPSRWKPFCFRSLPAAVDEIRDRMIETYLALGDRLSEAMRKRIYRSVAEIEAAREQYFGPSST